MKQSHRSRPWLAWLCGLSLGVLATATIFVLPARNRVEVPENLVLGVMAGLACGVILAMASLGGRFVARFAAPQSWRMWVTSLTAILFIGLMGFALARSLHQPVIVPTLLLLPATVVLGVTVLSDYRIGFSARAMTLVAAGLILAIGLLASAGPIRSMPVAVTRAPASGDDLVVMTWNTGLGNPGAAPTLAQSIPAIARVIVESGADVVCLQEFGDHRLAELLHELGPAWRGATSRSDNLWATAIVTKRVGGDEVQFQTRDLPGFNGGPASMVLDFPGAGVTIECLSVHLAPGRASEARRAQIDSLIGYTAGEGRRRAVVIAGDTNIDPASPWDRMTPMFTDSVQRDWDNLGLLWTMGTDAGNGAAATATLSRRIDRIIIPPSLQLVEQRILTGCRIGRMDHSPVMVRLRVQT